MIQIPRDFAEEITEREGANGIAWLESLPALAKHYCTLWSLEPDGEPMHGCAGIVIPVSRAGVSDSVLKLSWIDAETRDEPTALSTWNGSGSARLIESDPDAGALLLERLDWTRSLNTEPINYAIEICGQLLHELTVPASKLSRCLRTESRQLLSRLPAKHERLGKPLPRRILDAAVGVCGDLGPETGSYLVNEDLHFENVLTAMRKDRGNSKQPWLAIDPKPLEGDPEFSTIMLLWNRFDESTLDNKFSALVSSAALDADRARAWTLVRGVQNWLTAIDDEQDEDVPAIACITEWAYRGIH